MEGLLQDLDEVPQIQKALAYADDLLLIIAADSRRRLEERANTALSRLERWCEAQKLQISTGKTTFTMLPCSMQRSPLIRLGGRTLRRQVVTKYLGIDMGERGSFAEHITQMASIVTYGASVWAHKAKQVRPRQKLNAAQRGVLITLTGAYRTTSAEALQVIVGILPGEGRQRGWKNFCRLDQLQNNK
ncbi:hypothetical protein Trydic_g23694 [Trypoxylus dichotomus]